MKAAVCALKRNKAGQGDRNNEWWILDKWGVVEIFSEKLTLSRGLNVKKEPSWQRSLRSKFQVDAKAPSPEVLVNVKIF